MTTIWNVVLVHGAWAAASSWSKLIPLLLDSGLKVTAVQLPLTSFEADVEAVTRGIALAEGPVVLIGHSYGGAVITQAGNEEHGVGVVAYSPFGHGDFPGPRTRGGAVLEDIAATHGATARQVALRFLVRQPAVFAIPKASSVEHAAENAGAGALRLTEAEIARIDAAFPRGARPSRLPML